ncbi:glycosyltransferase family 59 protein [Xylariaceae sp. FL0594]|nr:glycosyltransferase family 59 protein [Xylariaceae sp. FL0594]
MSAPTQHGEQPVAVWVVRLLLVCSISYLSTRRAQLRGSALAITMALSCISPLALSWLATVNKNVPEPYLDEIFHIPQAQVYCLGKYSQWDDKITTPPGLYIVTLLFNRVLGLTCSVLNLRAFNADMVACISVVALACKAQYRQCFAQADTGRRISIPDVLTGISIASFPVIFFFSGLYYTDPSSTLIVLLAYANHLSRIGTGKPTLLNDLYTLFLGITALGFRQTNIFWAVVYMGGLETIQALKTLNPEPVETPKFSTVADQVKFYAWRYSLGDVHDPPVSLAQPIGKYTSIPFPSSSLMVADVLLCILSIATAALWNLPKVIAGFMRPHGIVLLAFAAFVAWNGGVVLGDKSNHIATLHSAQMLYIWPLFVFFSAPLFIPRILDLGGDVLRAVNPRRTPSVPHPSPSSNADTQMALFHRVTTALVFLGAVASALLIVHFNTVIHPFTLADNRHYMFYVFRYSILRAWWVRYAVAPIYVVCAWMCWATLQGPRGDSAVRGERWIRSPFTTTAPQQAANAQSVSRQTKTQTLTDKAVSASPPTSTALMLLLATTLSLVTAPLVEPRYFILPWVFWRLLVPHPMPSSSTGVTNAVPATRSRGTYAAETSKPSQPKFSGRRTTGSVAACLVLALEIVWFMLINFATMYIFIARPFYWRAPDGSLLDEGRVQRFMW